MGLPGKRLSRSSKRRRADNFGLAAISTGVCPRCQANILPHRACKECGYYRGHSTRSLVAPKTKKVKAEKK